MIGHEIAHIAAGHLRKDQDSTQKLPFPVLFEWGRQAFLTLLGEDAEQYIDRYKEQYWTTHERELTADIVGLLYAAGDGPQGALDLRLMGAQMAICTISFLDRASFSKQHKFDLAEFVGLDN